MNTSNKKNINTLELTIAQAHEDMKSGVYGAVDLAQACLEIIKSRDGEIHAFLEIYDDVLEQAKRADEVFAQGKATLLTGIPLAIKDNILVKGRKASSASHILEGYVAPYNATVIERLLAQGAVLIGRTNMDEFAMGSSTENSAYGVTHNPHDAIRVPGGTSGGTAAAVAAGMVLGGLGSDTGGSVRQPAALSGVVGLKPTYGRVSRYGLMAAVSSFDQIGPIASTVDDARIIYDAIKGYDVHDGTSLEDDYPNPKSQSKVIGIPRQFINREGLDPEVRQAFDASCAKLQARGYVLKDISLPILEHVLSVYYILNFAEVSSNLARYDGVKYGLHVDGDNLLSDYVKTRGAGFGAEARRRILLGSYVLSSGYYDAYYYKAIRLREAIAKSLVEAFADVDVIAMPTTPSPAWIIGSKNTNPLEVYLADIFTVTANVAGIPAISVPMRQTPLPLGFQLMGPHGGEESVLDIARDLYGSQ